ncbi:hypothetical protein [Paraburkholderia adhaesiva]|uniref:hypothetical protein n=1 Tax=Paraburkholderia adhaesiva TaxID=2883244 RepID=UPI001F234E00|nr:hypothetical protein [Paraburkholderia adhaesiva]
MVFAWRAFQTKLHEHERVDWERASIAVFGVPWGVCGVDCGKLAFVTKLLTGGPLAGCLAEVTARIEESMAPALPDEIQSGSWPARTAWSVASYTSIEDQNL